MAGISLHIDQLLLDHENPRITRAESQRDALQKILDDQDLKLVVLSESIVAEGLNPMDRLLVIAAPGSPDTFIVVEGNRRLASIKLISNPAVMTGLEVRPSVQSRLEVLAAGFDRHRIEPIDCFEVADRMAAVPWIQQRHTGENEGRGIVSWSGIVRARFRGRDPALQGLDLVLEHGGLTASDKESIEQRFPISTLDRLLSTPDVRTLMGMEVSSGKLLTGLPFDEVIRVLSRIVGDLANGIINVTGLKLKDQQVDYVKGLGKDLPDLSLATGLLVPVESLRAAPAPPHRPTPPKPRPPKPPSRLTVIPRAHTLNVTSSKIGEIYSELRSLRLNEHPHAISVLLRVFLETSVDEYLIRNSIPLASPGPGGSKPKTLKIKLSETIADIVSKGGSRKDFDGVKKGIHDPTHPLSIDLLHAYVHNRFVSPKERDLTVAWDNAFPLFQRIWP